MMHDQMIVTIDRLDRLQNTVDGNPRWRVHLRGGATCLTHPNSAAANSIGNSENMHRPVLISTDSKGRIATIEPRPFTELTHVEWHERTFMEMGSKLCLQCIGDRVGAA